MRAPITDKHLLEMMWERFPEIMQRGAEQPAQQEPVAWVGSLKDPQPHCVTDLKYCSAAQWDTGYHLKYIPLYTSPPNVATPLAASDYAWPTIANYEEDVGFKVNETFRMAWNMARTTNDLFKLKEKNT